MIWRSFSMLDMRDTPPSARMSAGTLSSAMTEVAPASSAILAWSAVTTSHDDAALEHFGEAGLEAQGASLAILYLAHSAISFRAVP